MSLLSNYKNLQQAVDWLWNNRKQLKKQMDEIGIDFDFPDYAGMPKRIHNKLTPRQVDLIQDFAGELLTIKTKKEFESLLEQ